MKEIYKSRCSRYGGKKIRMTAHRSARKNTKQNLKKEKG